jgi:hypothetical protein
LGDGSTPLVPGDSSKRRIYGVRISTVGQRRLESPSGRKTSTASRQPSAMVT